MIGYINFAILIVFEGVFMKCRKLLIVLAIFNAIVNTLYLVRFFGVLGPDSVVYGYVPWFMSFALPNIVFSLIAWLLVITLLKKYTTLAVVVGLVNAGGLIFHALNGFMFVFYTGSLAELTIFNAIFEVVVYLYGLVLAAFYISYFLQSIKNLSDKNKEQNKIL